MNSSGLWVAVSIGSDFVQSYNACERIQPNHEGNQIENDVKNWYSNNSFVTNSKVGSSINDIDSLAEMFPSTHDANAVAASNAGKSNATD
jgi:hypothetical protein